MYGYFYDEKLDLNERTATALVLGNFGKAAPAFSEAANVSPAEIVFERFAQQQQTPRLTDICPVARRQQQMS